MSKLNRNPGSCRAVQKAVHTGTQKGHENTVNHEQSCSQNREERHMHRISCDIIVYSASFVLCVFVKSNQVKHLSHSTTDTVAIFLSISEAERLVVKCVGIPLEINKS